MSDTILPLSEYEKMPDFPTDPVKKSQFYENYFQLTEDSIDSVESANAWNENKARHSAGQLTSEIKTKYPGRSITPDELSSSDEFAEYKDRIAEVSSLGEYNAFNEKSPSNEYQSTTGRKMAVKPVRYGNDKIAYSVTYPDGTNEFIKADSPSVMMGYIGKNRRDRFKDNGGIISDSEFDEIYDGVSNTEGGMAGAWGSVKQTVSNIKQSFQLTGINSAINAGAKFNRNIEKNQNRKAELSSQMELLKKKPDFNENDQIAYDNLLDDYNNLDADLASTAYENFKSSQPGTLGDSISNFISERQKASQIKGARSLSMLNSNIDSVQNNDDTASGVVTFFKENPDQIIPWVASTVISSSPDMAAGIGSAAVGTAIGGAVGGAGAAGSYGYIREYTSAFLEEMQETAAANKLDLSDANDITKILLDPKFKERAERKATVRAGVIGTADAVFGGMFGKVADLVEGSFKRAATRTLIDATTEGAGEALAQYADEGKLKASEILGESLGSLGTAVASPVVDAVTDKLNTATIRARQKIKGNIPSSNTPTPVVPPTLPLPPQSEAGKPSNQVSPPSKNAGSSGYDDNGSILPSIRNRIDRYSREHPNSPSLTIEEAVIAEQAESEASKKASDDAMKADLAAAEANGDNILASALAAKIKGDYTEPEQQDITPDYENNADAADNTGRPQPGNQDRLSITSPLPEQESNIEILEDRKNYDEPLSSDYIDQFKADRFDSSPGDLFIELSSLSLLAGKNPSNPTSVQDAQRVAALIDIISNKGGVTEYQMRDSFKSYVSTDPEDQESVKATFESAKRWMDYLTNPINVNTNPIRYIDIATDPIRETLKEREVIESQLTEPSATVESNINKPLVDRSKKRINEISAIIAQNQTKSPSVTRGLAQALRSDYVREAYKVLSNHPDWKYIQEDFSTANPVDASGRMLDLFNVKDIDKRRIITNVLGTYWGQTPTDAYTTDERQDNGAIALSHSLDAIYGGTNNILNYYTDDLSDVEAINKDDIALFIGPDNYTGNAEDFTHDVDSDGNYLYYDDTPSQFPFMAFILNVNKAVKAIPIEEAQSRYDATKNAQQVRTPSYNPDTGDKFKEAKSLQKAKKLKDGVIEPVYRMSDIADNAQDFADRFGNFFRGDVVFKPSDGSNSKGVRLMSSPTKNQLKELYEFYQNQTTDGGVPQLDNYYIENMVYPDTDNANKRGSFKEFRVHIYVDKKGNARAFKNLTFDKEKTYWGRSDPRRSAVFPVPESPNDPSIAQLQEYAQQIMGKQKLVKDAIFGLDMAFVIDRYGKKRPHIFETNAIGYGMSGWLGYHATSAEIISEFSGRPSMFAGIYQIVKSGLNRSQLTEIINRVENNLPLTYLDEPDINRMVNAGFKLYNKFTSFKKWDKAMSRAFSTASPTTRADIWKSIYQVASTTVDYEFEAKIDPGSIKVSVPTSSYYESLPFPRKLLSKADIANGKMTALLETFLKVSNNSEYKSIVKAILENGSDTFLRKTDVFINYNSKNQYLSSSRKVNIDASTDEAVVLHEIIHSFTSDFLIENNVKALGIDYHKLSPGKHFESIISLASDSNKRKEALDKGVSPLYLDLLDLFIQSISYGNEDLLRSMKDQGIEIPIGGGNPTDAYSNYYKYNKDKSSPLNSLIRYGHINIEEFVAEAFTNEEFRNHLSSLPSTKGEKYSPEKSIFYKFIDFLQNLLGLSGKDRSALTDVISLSGEIIKDKSNNRYFPEGAIVNMALYSESNTPGWNKIGIQKDINGNPAWELVNIQDPTSQFDGSTLMVKNGSSNEEIQEIVNKKTGRSYMSGYDDYGFAVDIRPSLKRITKGNKTPTLRRFIKDVIKTVPFNEPQKQFLEYVLNNSSNTFLDKIKVKVDNRSSSEYNLREKLIKFGYASPATIIHEISHAVTSDFLVNQENIALFDIEGYSISNKSYFDRLAEIVSPQGRLEWEAKGLSSNYIDLAEAYLSALQQSGYAPNDSVGANGDIPFGGIYQSGYTYIQKDKGFPYGLADIHEFVAESISNVFFQKKLEGMKSIPGRSYKSILSYVIASIRKILGIPYHKNTLLEDTIFTVASTIADKGNNYFAYSARRKSFFSSDKFSKDRGENVDKKFIRVGNKTFKKDLLSPETISQLTELQRAEKNLKKGIPSGMSELARKKIIAGAVREINEAKWLDLYKQYPDAFKGSVALESGEHVDFAWTGNNLPQARAIVVQYLDSLDDDAGATKGKKESQPTPKRIESIMQLNENRYNAREFFDDVIMIDGLTEDIVQHIENAYQYLMTVTEDTENLSTRRINMYSQIFASLGDGDIPIGLSKAMKEQFNTQMLGELDQVRAEASFNDPIGDWRRKPLFGIFFRGDDSSLAMQATEVNQIAPAKKAYDYINKLFSIYKGNVERQEVEEQVLHNELNTLINSLYGKKGIDPISRNRIGWVATLTQYDLGKPNYESQLTELSRKAVDGLKTRELQNGELELSQISSTALTQVTQGVPYGQANHIAIVNSLENNLNPNERKVLDKMREIGKRYYNPLRIVRLVAGGTTLPQYANYVSRIARSADKEQVKTWGVAAFNAMQPVLKPRTTIDSLKQWWDSDIMAIADASFEQMTYEKHTGVQRTLIKELMNTQTFVAGIDENVRNPVRTNRLKTLLGNYHVAKMSGNGRSSAAMNLIYNAMGAFISPMISGINAFIKNSFSSLVSSTYTLTEKGAAQHMFAFAQNYNKMEKFFKDFVPTQYKRLNQFDNGRPIPEKYSIKASVENQRAVGKSIAKAITLTVPRFPFSAVAGTNKALGLLVKVSNSIPESLSAKSIWTAVYISRLIEKGKVKSQDDFMIKPFYDAEEATYANASADSALGYAARREDKGSFWYGDSEAKELLSRTLYFFKQQQIGLSLEGQTNMLNAMRFAVNSPKLAAKFASRAVTQIMNSLAFRHWSKILAGYMAYGSLELYLNSKDPEDSKRKIAETIAKRQRSVDRIQMKDFVFETISSNLPISTSAPLIEPLAEYALDATPYVYTFEGMASLMKGGPLIESRLKEDLKKNVDELDEEIQRREKWIDSGKELGISTQAFEEQIEGLKIQKDQLTELLKFKYFPNDPKKAFGRMLGSFGIAHENAFELIDSFIGDDLNSDDKRRLDEMMKTDLAIQSPFELQALSLLKFGMNPRGVIESANKELAKDALKEEKAKEKIVEELKAKYGLQP